MHSWWLHTPTLGKISYRGANSATENAAQATGENSHENDFRDFCIFYVVAELMKDAQTEGKKLSVTRNRASSGQKRGPSSLARRVAKASETLGVRFVRECRRKKNRARTGAHNSGLYENPVPRRPPAIAGTQLTTVRFSRAVFTRHGANDKRFKLHSPRA